MYELGPNKSLLNAVHGVVFPSLLLSLPDVPANCIIKLEVKSCWPFDLFIYCQLSQSLLQRW